VVVMDAGLEDGPHGGGCTGGACVSLADGLRAECEERDQVGALDEWVGA